MNKAELQEGYYWCDDGTCSRIGEYLDGKLFFCGISQPQEVEEFINLIGPIPYPGDEQGTGILELGNKINPDYKEGFISMEEYERRINGLSTND